MKRMLLLFLFLSVVLVRPAFAQMPTPTPTPVDYTLPYPGILPDNPLYKIKAFRDWLVSILIVDPLKKSEFDILQADKRLVSAQDLLMQTPPKAALAIDTLSKGENYFFQAIAQVRQAKMQGDSVYDILQKLHISNAKHLEVVRQMEQTATGDTLKALKEQESRMLELRNSVMQEGSR